MTDLFDRSDNPLQQTSGDLAPRYSQDGSKLIRVYSTKAGDGALYTVTKRAFYITSLTVHQKNGSGSTYVDFTDGIGGDDVWKYKICTESSNTTMLFDPPAKVTTSLYATKIAGNAIDFDYLIDNGVIILGWEE